VRNVRRLQLVLVLLAVVVLWAAAGVSASPSDPNDPYWQNEWGPVLTRASDLWQYSTGSPGVVIAVVDTGYTAPALKDMANVLPGWDILGNDANTADTFGHGTWVSTIIGAQGDNGVGMAGYCWQCSILPVKVASGRQGTVAGDIAAGIRWAVDHGARIVNVSLASNQFDENELGAAEYAQQHGVLIVASAGNGGNTAPLYPADYGTTLSNVLAVAGTDPNDQLYSWATRGSWVQLSAPGCAEFLDPWIGPAEACGSSFGPPAVSGIAGLLMSLDPSLTVNQVVGALEATAVHVDGLADGRVDAWAAAHSLGLVPAAPPAVPAPATPPPPAPSPEVQVTTGYVRRSAVIRLPLKVGKLEIQLTGPAARDCTLDMRVSGQLVVGLAAESTVSTLATTIEKAGSYPVGIRCNSVNRKAYEFTATALFLD
jgi:Subtilase family